MVESVIAVFALGAIAGGVGVYLWTQRTLRAALAFERKRAHGWEDRCRMTSEVLNSVLRLERERRAAAPMRVVK